MSEVGLLSVHPETNHRCYSIYLLYLERYMRCTYSVIIDINRLPHELWNTAAIWKKGPSGIVIFCNWNSWHNWKNMIVHSLVHAWLALGHPHLFKECCGDLHKVLWHLFLWCLWRCAHCTTWTANRCARDMLRLRTVDSLVVEKMLPHLTMPIHWCHHY